MNNYVWVIECSHKGGKFVPFFDGGVFWKKRHAMTKIQDRFSVDREYEKTYRRKVNFSYRAVKYVSVTK